MLKTISAALVAASMIAAPVLAANASKTEAAKPAVTKSVTDANAKVAPAKAKTAKATTVKKVRHVRAHRHGKVHAMHRGHVKKVAVKKSAKQASQPMIKTDRKG